MMIVGGQMEACTPTIIDYHCISLNIMGRLTEALHVIILVLDIPLTGGKEVHQPH